MNLKQKSRWWPLALVAFLAGCFLVAYHVDRLHRQVETLRKDSHSMAEAMQQLSTTSQELARENRQLKYIQDLAIEFSVDPAIVALVDHYSQQYLREPGPEWRLVRTPEFSTYIMLSLIYAESKGNPRAVGDGGRARGLTQIWVSTAREYGEVTAEQLHDPETNLSFAFKHFHYLLSKYRGNLALALYAWNRGAGKVDNLLLYGESPENGYAQKVYEAALLNNRHYLIDLTQ